MQKVESVKNTGVQAMEDVLSSKTGGNLPYNELRQRADLLEAEVTRLKGLVDYQHAIIVNQQPTMAQLQWEASKWNHYKRLIEAREGKSAVAEAETAVMQRMAGLL